MDLKAYYRQKRRTEFLRRIIVGSFILIAFLTAAWGVFWAPFLRVKNIEVENYPDETAIKENILRRLNSKNMFYLPVSSFFLVSAFEIADSLKAGGFGLAEIEKKFPKTLVVSFPETKPWLIFCLPDSCFYVNESGVLEDVTPKFSKSPLPEIIINSYLENSKHSGESVLDESRARFLRVAFDYLKSAGAEADKIEFQENGDAKIFLKEGWFVYFSLGADPIKTFSDLVLLLNEKIKDGRGKLEYIDLRFENKAFYKLKSID